MILAFQDVKWYGVDLTTCLLLKNQLNLITIWHFMKEQNIPMSHEYDKIFLTC